MVQIVFATLTSISPNWSGHQGSMQMGGSFVFTCIVIVANVKLIISSYEMTVRLWLLILTSIIVYIACFWYITWWSAAADDFGIFIELFVNAETYVSLIFFMSSYVLIDSG